MSWLGISIIIITFFYSAYLYLIKRRTWQRLLPFFMAGVLVGSIISVNNVLILEYKGFKLSAFYNKAKEVSEEISKIREEVNNQKSEINMVVRDADAAREKINTIDSTIKTANIKLQEISNINDLTLTFFKAHNDDRKAFDALNELANKPGPFQELANNQFIQIVSELSINMGFGNEPTFNWAAYKIYPETASFEELKAVYNAAPGLLKPSIMDTIWNQNRFSKYERLEFLYVVIKSDPSLHALQRACRLMTSEAKINANFLGAKQFEQWWENNKLSYLDK